MKAKLAFCLFKYFPYGGLQGDFLRIALECERRGFEIIVFTRSWEGEIPGGFDVRQQVPADAVSNHGKAKKFARWVCRELEKNPVDGVVGFNRMPGLDVYFASDNCYAEKATTQRNLLYRFMPRCRTYSLLEEAVFSIGSNTEILLISERQKVGYRSYYGTPEERLHLLPPGMDRARRRPENAGEIRARLRTELGVAQDEQLLIQVGSGFVTKGVDRSIRALAALPDEITQKTRLLIVGRDRASRFIRLAEQLDVADRVDFLGGRNDVPELLVAADLMIHPAINEAAGIVLLEALAAGLPVLCTEACGHSPHVARSDGGKVLSGPFDQSRLNKLLHGLLQHEDLAALGECALAYADETDLYSQHEHAADFIEETVGKKS